MDTNNGHSSRMSSDPGRKRKLSRDSHSPLDRHDIRADAMDDDLQSMGQDSQKLYRYLKSKNHKLESSIQNICVDLKAMKYENQNLKVQVDNLQQKCDRLVSQNRQNYSSKQPSREKESDDPNVDELLKDFAERFALVDSDNQDLIERLDTCQQTFENQLFNIQERMDNFQIHDTHIQQIAEDNQYQNQLKEIKTDLPGAMNTLEDHFHKNKDKCTVIEEALSAPCEEQIQLPTDQIQYGLFDVCDKYNVIVMKEKDKLRLFDYQKQIDECGWGELGRANFATCIHWCSFLDHFLILYRYGLYQLSLKQNSNGSQMKFDDIIQIKSIRVYSLKHDTTNRCNNIVELLRFITTSPNLPGYLYLNRGYRRIELINTNSWKMKRGWSKQDLNYDDRDEVRSITLSYDGSYLAMNIKWNDCKRFIDLRKHDGQLTLLKRIRMKKDSMSLLYGIQVPFDEEKWLVINADNNQCYKVSVNPDDEGIIPMRTDHIQAIENIAFHLRFVRDHKYLLVGALISNGMNKQGVLRFYKLPNL